MSARRAAAAVVGVAVLAAVLMSVVVAPAAAPKPPALPAPTVSWLRAPANLAHAMGGLQVSTSKGDVVYTYTNTLEAFEQNYAKGYRIFEVDLILTRDAHLVARHDWSKKTFKALGQKVPSRVPSHSEFRATKVLGRFTPLDVEGVVDILRKHPDVYIITDTKSWDSWRIKTAFRGLVRAMGAEKATLSKRVIVQIYNEPMLKKVRAVHPFPNIIYTLYKQPLKGSVSVRAARFARTHGIRVVTIDLRRYSPSVVRTIRSQGVAVAVNTVNSSGSATKLYSGGVRFLYSDVLAGRPGGSSARTISSVPLPLAPGAIPFNPSDD